MVNVLSLPDDLLGRLAYPEGWHDFQWWITLRLGFQAPKMGLTGPVERGLIELNSSEWSVQACPDLIWEIPASTPPSLRNAPDCHSRLRGNDNRGERLPAFFLMIANVARPMKTGDPWHIFLLDT